MLRTNWSFRTRLFASVGSFAVYIGAFFLLWPIIGMPTGAAGFVPVFLTGLLLGTRGGIAAGLFVPIMDEFTYGVVLGSAFENLFSITDVLVTSIALAIGGVSGRMSDLSVELVRQGEQLADSDRRFKLITAATGDIVWEFNPQTNEFWASEAFRRLIGKQGEAAMTDIAGFLAQMPQAESEAIEAAIKKTLANGGSQVGGEHQLKAHDGTIHHMEWQAVVVRDEEGRPETLVGSTRDVTQVLAAEAARQQTARAQERLEQAEQASAFKSQLLNMASHELTTPISALKLQLFLAKGALDKGSLDEAKTAFPILERNVDRLAALIADTLDISRIQSGKLSIKPAPLDGEATLRDLVSTYGPSAEQAGLELTMFCEPGLHIEADPGRLTQVLTNLVGNAIKFTPSGGKVIVAAMRKGDDATFEVRDTGIGMDEHQIAKLFQPFVRVHDETHEIRGTGLGLSISRGIVEAHGGHIGCQSDGPGRGTTFWFNVPLKARPVQVTAASLAS